MNKLIIIGASGHGRVLADIAELVGYSDIAFLDDSDVKACGMHPVVGRCADAAKYKDCDFIVAIGNAAVRRKIQSALAADGSKFVSLIHPAATVASSASIGEGSAVMAGAVVNPYAKIGKGCIVNTCASVDHDCTVGDFAHVSIGAHVAGTVNIGDNTWIGAGATVINNIAISADCMIGAGAVVVKSITDPGTYVGVPARKVK